MKCGVKCMCKLLLLLLLAFIPFNCYRWVLSEFWPAEEDKGSPQSRHGAGKALGGEADGESGCCQTSSRTGDPFSVLDQDAFKHNPELSSVSECIESTVLLCCQI